MSVSDVLAVSAMFIVPLAFLAGVYYRYRKKFPLETSAGDVLASIPLRTYLVIVFTTIVVFALLLLLMGRVPWCKCGYVKLWHGVTMSSENSQHISDWYTPSHIIHGFGFYALFWWWLGRRRGWPLGLRLVCSLLAETVWEVFENTDFTINRYRAVTISLDYYGDSVLNSICDVLAMVAGFLLANRFAVWVIIALALIMELVVGYYIRDNLILNIIMLIYPAEVILRWQQGG